MRETHALGSPRVLYRLDDGTSHEFQPCAGFKVQKAGFEAFGGINVLCSGYGPKILRVKFGKTLQVLGPNGNVLEAHLVLPAVAPAPTQRISFEVEDNQEQPEHGDEKCAACGGVTARKSRHRGKKEGQPTS
jgi:hypothetical protein